MKQNTKAYHSGFSSSFQRSSYQTNPEKAKLVNAERWDHKGYEQLEFEQENPKALTNNEEKIETSKQQKPRREKKPDRQLYSVRQRNNLRQESELKNKDSLQNSEKLNEDQTSKNQESSSYKQMVKEMLSACEDKEAYPFEDDKLSVSNVSTAFSDKFKGTEEDISIKCEQIKEEDDFNDSIPSPTLPSSEILFELVLQTGNGMINITMYKDDDDIESMLDNICLSSSLDPTASLYLKINVLQYIKESIESNEKVDACLDNLLNLNYKLIMYENGLGEFEECLAPFIKNESQNSFETLAF